MKTPDLLSVVISLVVLAIRPAYGQSPSLKAAFAPHFKVGVAIATDTLVVPEQEALHKIASEFNSATSENLLKWELVHPEPGRYDFEAADRFVEFGEKHELFLVGHTLVWHNQMPRWVFEDDQGRPLSEAELLERMRNHIHAVVGRYRGRIDAWDVVNEALNDDGTMRETRWQRIIGDEYVVHAFRFAREVDPQCELYYNDYNLHLADKRDGLVHLIARLKRSGVSVDGIGMQGHWMLDSPPEADIVKSIRTYAGIAGKVMITELDVDVLPRPNSLDGAEVQDVRRNSGEMDPYRDALPPSVHERLAERYARLFKLFLRRSDVIDRVTFWGLDDGRSWHNNWPITGRTAHSLLFDRSLSPKPAYHAVLEVAADGGD